MRVMVLGPVRVEVDDREVQVGGPQRRMVLALLAADRILTTDQLVDRLWGDEPPANARKAVQIHISKLRSALGGAAQIDTVGDGYRLSGDAEVDADEFRRLVEQGRELLADRPDLAAETLRRAFALWHGPPYADLYYEESLAAEIRRLEELHLAATEDLIEADIATGQAAAAAAQLDLLCAEHPDRERLRALQMTALYRIGQQREALAVYRAFAEHLAEESGLEPSPQLRDLELRILQHDPMLGPALPSPITALPATNLPHRYSSFVGRDAEISAVAARLTKGRLVTVVGPGGIGKSSLAVEALRSLDPSTFAATYWVEVETSEPGSLSSTVASAMGLQPGPSVDPVTLIGAFTAGRRCALLLDGCERLIDEAAATADRLLRLCPDLRIVVTSRESLGLAGEAVERVGGLDAEAARDLLVERSAVDTAGTSIELIDSVCTALDGIPLAIELAAAQIRSLSLPTVLDLLADQIDLLERSRSGDDRHRSLAVALDASYRMLDEEQARLFRMLSIFRTGFETQAAPAFLMSDRAMAALRRLVEVSLVEPPNAGGTCRMLEPIRQYAEFHLDRSGERPEALRLHAKWMLERSRQASAADRTPEAVSARNWIADNRFEVAAALRWSLELSEPDLGVGILAAVGRRLANQGYGAVLEPLAVELVGHPEADPTPELAAAMAHTTHLLHLAGDDETALEVIQAAEELSRRLDDAEALGGALVRKAAFLSDYRRIPDGLEIMLRGVTLLEESGAIDPLEYYNVALEALGRGDERLAEEYARKGVDWEVEHNGRSLGDQELVLSLGAMIRGDLDAAIQLARQSLAGRLEQQVLLQAHASCLTLANLCAYSGRYDEAAEAIETLEQIGRLVGIPEIHAPTVMRIAAAAGDAAAVIEAAREWFSSVTDQDRPGTIRPPGVHMFLIGDLLRGELLETPAFLDVLLPLTWALFEVGDTTTACRFAEVAPHLMTQSRFEAWDEIGETSRWRALADRCQSHDVEEPGPLSLDEAFWEAARAVESIG